MLSNLELLFFLDPRRMAKSYSFENYHPFSNKNHLPNLHFEVPRSTLVFGGPSSVAEVKHHQPTNNQLSIF